MDFKNLLKSKYFIIICVLCVLICISAALTEISNMFYIIACLLCTALCVMVGVKNILNYKKAKENHDDELLPLTQEQREMVKRNKRSVNAGYIVKAIMFFVFGIVFFALIFN